MATFDPATYTCDTHNVDLTSQVTRAAPASDHVYGLTADRRGGPRLFAVVVRCPGAGADGPHDVVASGMWQP